MGRRGSLAAVVVVSFLTFAASAFADPPSVAPLPDPAAPWRRVQPILLSNDGSVFCVCLDNSGALGSRLFRYRQGGPALPVQATGYFTTITHQSAAQRGSRKSSFLAGAELGSRPGAGSFLAPVVWNSSGVPTRLDALIVGTAPSSNAPRDGDADCVSADGVHVAGVVRKYVNGSDRGLVPVRWNAGGAPTELSGGGVPILISDDGAAVVGTASVYHSGYDVEWSAIVRWDQNGNRTVFPALERHPEGDAFSFPYDISSDGSVVVGYCRVEYDAGLDNGTRAVRWAGGTHQYVGPQVPTALGEFEERAEHCSSDGSVVVGHYRHPSGNLRTFRWDATSEQPADLGTLYRSGSQFVGFSRPQGMSDDGRTIVGYSGQNSSRQACVWRDGQPRSLWDLLENEYQVDLTGWTEFREIVDCTPDGETVAGYGSYNGVFAPFVAHIPLNQPPTLKTAVASSVDVKVGETFTGRFIGSDADHDALTVRASGLPAGASLDPASGSTDPTPENPFSATLTFTPTPAQFGESYDVEVSFDDGTAAPATKTVTLNVLPNAVPVVTAPLTRTLECDGATTDATFAATVFDDNEQPLTVSWYVDGVLVHQEVVPASETPTAVEYDHSFVHDPDDFAHESTTYVVEVEASDGYAAGSALTDVTIADTLAPFPSAAAPDILATTDPGKAYATLPVLDPQPTVVDQCDGDPTLELFARPKFHRYRIGVTQLRWFAIDAAGNMSDPIYQNVIVTDDEDPVFGDNLPGYVLPVDSGEIFATFAIPEPDVSDNDLVASLTSDAPANGTYPIGFTTVTWTAEDLSGNTATFQQVVEVVNQAPVADAGDDVTVDWTSAAGAPVTLSGSYEDADGHTATYLWSASGVVFDDPTSATPTGTFPVGTTTATLTVTDEGGAIGADTVEITVVQKYVIDTRDVATFDDCVAQTLSLCQALKAANPSSPYATYALRYAEYASAAHAESNLVTYFDENDLPGQTLLYKAKRYQQYKYSLYVAQYAHYVPGGADAKAAATCAGQGGLLDYNTP